ncbi:MAG: NnrU protein-domain-containing protein [Monoraphidium minutum]|nr:MAG: NnrU protein-domain-containing protein [Monoraphidium minutum]
MQALQQSSMPTGIARPALRRGLPSAARPAAAARPRRAAPAASPAPAAPPASRAAPRRAAPACRAQAQETPAALDGEDAAAFDWGQQSLKSWGIFGVLLTGVLGALYVVWIQPGVGVGSEYLAAVEKLTNDNPEATIIALLAIFAFAHSGLAGLRPKAEDVIGPRAYRVVFALVSLCLAVVPIVYFINHRYDGTQLWNIQGVPGVHSAVWLVNFVSFYFLYPSTFNILEVAAVDKPKLHMWETGIMRVTRHPQMVGQGLWCAAHCAWTGSSVVLAASAGLMAHHLFGCWHGDRRLRAKYGDAFDAVQSRTSVVPFAAILDGRQQLPADYYREFLRWPYVAVTVFTLGAYFAHPLMQQACYALKW